jgi:hypothetical protein
MRGRPGRYTVQPPVSLSRPEVMRGPRFTSTDPVQEPPPLTSSDFRCGPAILWAECRACAMGSAKPFKFRPLDKDDATHAEESSAWEIRWPPSRYNVQPPMSLTRPDVMRGPRFTSTGPGQEPPPFRSFVSQLGPPFCGPRAEPVRWVQGSF